MLSAETQLHSQGEFREVQVPVDSDGNNLPLRIHPKLALMKHSVSLAMDFTPRGVIRTVETLKHSNLRLPTPTILTI